MRVKLSLLALAVLVAGSVPALAQTNNTQNQNAVGNYYYSGPPVYNSANKTYYNAQNGTTPTYNNGTNVQVLPMQQMVAGKDAPSYNYNSKGTQPYTALGAGTYNPLSGVGSMGTLTPQQAQYYRAQQAQQAQQQTMYGQPQAQSQYQQNLNGWAPNISNYGQYYGNQPQAPVKKRVVYKRSDNLMVDPPKLFSND